MTAICHLDPIPSRHAMSKEEQVVLKLYEAIQAGDAAAAAECYRDDAKYRDLAFDLAGKPDIAAMWRLVCSRGVQVEFDDIRTEGDKVKGHWVFDYDFHGTNPVHNEMDSTFTFRNGRIFVHEDRASRWKWATQALGYPKGALVTVFPFLLRKQAREELEKFKRQERAEQAV
jgi:ketosteroid isomerase-like protein